MDEKKKYQIGGGPGFLGCLFLVFMTLKLTHVIDWSWWWVSAPLWIPWCVVLGLAVILGVLWAICAVLDKDGGGD